jgi:hypothetical protein
MKQEVVLYVFNLILIYQFSHSQLEINIAIHHPAKRARCTRPLVNTPFHYIHAKHTLSSNVSNFLENDQLGVTWSHLGFWGDTDIVEVSPFL